MKVSRRDLLLGTAGVTVGMVFTPVPWKLLGDVSVWTQNWPWVPQPQRGPVTAKQGLCTLCASGCPMRLCMAGGWPVGISGVKSNPLTKGALCSLGFAAHQLNWHPARLREVRHRGRVANWPEAQAALEKACSEGPVVVVDGRPGRAVSTVLQEFAEKHDVAYRVALSPGEKAFAPYADWTGIPSSSFGYDLENARTIVSFGTPLLEDWGIPGRFARVWSEKAAGKDDPELRLIQIDAKLSHTAACAWRWVAIREGSDAALAGAVARILVEDNLVPARVAIPVTMLEDAAAQTGLAVEAIRQLAHVLLEKKPTLVIARDGNPEIAALNVLLGRVGEPGGVVQRGGAGRAEVPLEENPSKYRAIVLDASVPWEFMPRTNAEVFRFAAWDGGGNTADWLLPSPGFLEEFTDVPTAPTAARENYGIAINLVPQPEGTRTSGQLLATIDSSLPTVEKTITSRCEQIFHSKHGAVYGDTVQAVAQMESAKKLEEQLRAGAIWVGDAPRATSLHCRLKEWPAPTRIEPGSDWAVEWPAPVLPPLAGKLYQESNLREAPERSRA